MTTYQKTLFLVFIAVFIWSAIHPVTAHEWVLESIPVVLAVPVIFFIGKRYKLSNLSYAFLTLYFCAALLPAHYNVASVPFGLTLGHWFGTDRNMYDRLLHFGFGLLCFSALYEVCLQLITKKSFWSYFIPFCTVLAFSSIYEIFEWLAHVFINPAASITFVGAQGDLWDPAKDMSCALVGAIISVTVMVMIDYRKQFRRTSLEKK